MTFENDFVIEPENGDYSDKSCNEATDKYVDEMSKKYPSLEISIVTYRSSGGGWPSLRLIGSKEDLTKFILNEYDQSATQEDLDFYIEEQQ